MKIKFTHIFLIVFTIISISSCKKPIDDTQQSNCARYDSIVQSGNFSYLVNQDFENASKNSYESAIINFDSQNWNFEDALVGTTQYDAKIEKKSVRIRNLGALEMKFDVKKAEMLSFLCAIYGADANSEIEIQYSTDQGNTWTKIDSYQVTSKDLKQVCFKVPETDVAIRFRILKTSGETTRINIDNFRLITTDTSVQVDTNENMLLGNPSNANDKLANSTNYLMVKPQFCLSYNTITSCPNWVSWHLSSKWLGDVSRYTGDFYPDPNLPAGWYAVQHSDYTYTGFDRGHMCPSADRTNTYEDNKATFMTTNIVPQSPNNNRKTWEGLESYCRTLVNNGDELYIIAGPYGTGGTGTYGFETSIANGNINVPQAVWKIVVVLSAGDDDIARINENTSVIAVYMPNEDLGSTPWTDYITTADSIESLTGYDFLSNVSESIQNVIEDKHYTSK